MFSRFASNFIPRCTSGLFLSLLLLVSPTVVTAGGCPQNVVISQVYGGGTGATYNNDFIELHNPTNAAISLSGLAIQYASATSSAWVANALPSVSLPGGAYFLIEGASNFGTAALPPPI